MVDLSTRIEAGNDNKSMTLSVLIVTGADYGYNAQAIEPVLKAEGVSVRGVTTIPPTVGTQSRISFARQAVSTFGPRLFLKQLMMRGKYVLRNLVSRVRREDKRYSPASLAEKYGVDHISVKSVNTDAYRRYVRDIDPDIVVAVGATERFEAALLSIPEEGCINVHDSLLPEYRGIMPSFWVLRHGEQKTGVTVHRMVPELDAGEILNQREVSIEPDDTYHTLRLRTAIHSGEALVETLDDITTESCNPEPLNVNEGSYYSFPEREDIRSFRQRGRTFY